ncbi:hypothetical protein V1503_19535 [Bacillus sp. SCS-151]|uniref:hypothetical protein n=1 Tax=Nanhaiella sioensis TaxID=3115293 RepID=UPI00397C8687
MKHIVFYSGGIGSWATVKRVVKKHGVKDLILLFTDTLIEDKDLYRFLIETSQEIFNIDCRDLIKMTEDIPDVSHKTMNLRKTYLMDLSDKVSKRLSQFKWIADGRDPWDIFKDVRWIGNSRIAQCSHMLKQDMSAKWLEGTYSPDECVLYLGIDWTEEHRTKAPTKNWRPYTVGFPMCEEPYLTKDEMLESLEELGVKIPRLYEMNFSHNNCGGFCVRAGQGHFINLLKQNPELYRYHEDKEKEMRNFLNKDVSILRRTRNKVRQNLTLEQLRRIHETGQEIDMIDIGGCGCFIQYEEVDKQWVNIKH